MTVNEALRLHHAGRLDEAERGYLEILAAQPNQYHALHFLGVLRAQQDNVAASVELIGRSLALFPDNGLAHFHLAESLRRLDRLGETVAHYRRALALEPGLDPAYMRLGECLVESGQPGEALAVCDTGLKRNGSDASLYACRGDALLALGRSGEALADYDKALALEPTFVGGLIRWARLTFENGRTSEAFAALGTAIDAHPDAPEPHISRAIFLTELGRRDEAFAAYQDALARDPAAADTYYNMGCLLLDTGALDAALAAFESVLAIRPGFEPAHYNRAFALERLDRFDDALAASDAALAINPDSGLAASKSFLGRARRCDWSDREGRLGELERLTRAGKKVDSYALALAFDDPALLQTAAVNWASSAAPPMPQRPLSEDRLRIAYISPNFHEHPVAHMAVEVFEAHDRARFETFGICVAPGPDKPIRQRLRGAFDHFIEAGHTSDRALAERLAEHGIDIAVDLAGYTADGHTAALRHRPAPLAVGWLGFPGTTGAPYVDYLIADPTIVPPEDERWYCEKVVRLPQTYMPRDAGLSLGASPPRSALGLPEDGFVFAGFNNALKFTPAVFAVWMRLLQVVDGSVLWLNSQNEAVRQNLGREASRQGVAPERIVFASRLDSRADHLARLAAADLFLDTLPYGAHSTASDFLWAGVPVLTVVGRSFATRVAAGLLIGLGLPELIAPDLAAYEAAGLALARAPDRLAVLRQKLAASRRASGLFDPVRFCRSLESAYESMARRARDGLPPIGFSVHMPES